MGYEIKLIVGKTGHSSPEYKREKKAELDDDIAWFPAVRDENDNFVETGRTEIYFQVYGMVDLCSPGHDSHLLKLDWRNKESDSVCWFFYHTDGNTDAREDCYGDAFKPLPVADVIAALERDFEESKEAHEGGYRRFRWALGYLKAMDDDAQVMLYGY